MEDVNIIGKEQQIDRKISSLENLSDADLVNEYLKSKPVEEMTDDELQMVHSVLNVTGSQPEVKKESKKAEAFLEGYGKAATFGTLPTLQAYSEQATMPIFSYLTGKDVEPEPIEKAERYYQKRGKELEEAEPTSSFAGQVAGFALSGAPILKGTQAAGRAALGVLGKAPAMQKAIETTGRVLSAPKGVSQKAFKLAAESASLAPAAGIQMSLYGEPDEYGQYPDFEERLREGTRAALMTPAFGAGISLGLKGVSAAIKGTGYGLAYLAGGVKPENIQRYIKNPELIREAEKEGVKGITTKIEAIVGRIKNDLDNANIDADEARRALEDTKKVLLNEVKVHKREASEALKNAELRLEAAIKTKIENLETIKPPVELVEDIKDVVKNISREVSDLSSESLAILKQDAPIIDKKPLYNILQKAREDILVGDKPFPGTEKVLNEIDGLETFLKSIGTDDGIDAVSAKKIMQNIDRLVDYGVGDYSVSSFINNLGKKIRHEISEQAKTLSPEYKKIMDEQVAPRAKLIEDFRKIFGSEYDDLNNKLYNKLTAIDKESMLAEKRILADLETFGEKKIMPKIDAYIQARNELKALKDSNNPLYKQYFEKEIKDYDEALQILNEKKRRFPFEIEDEIKQDERYRAALAEKEAAESKLKVNERLAEDLSFFISGSPYAKTMQYLKEQAQPAFLQNPEVMDAWKKLIAMSNEEFTQAITAITDASVFNPKILQKNGRGILASFMSKAGYVGATKMAAGVAAGSSVAGLVGAGVGLGSVVLADMFGPTVTKTILDGYLNALSMGRMFTPKFIKKLAIPKEAKAFLIRDFYLSFGDAKTQQLSKKVQIPIEAIPIIEAEIKDSTNLNNTEKAKNLDSLHKQNTVLDFDKIVDDDVLLEEVEQ